MSNGLMAFIVALSAAAWIYSKVYRSSGGQNKQAALIAGISGVALFVVVLIVLNAIFKSE